MCDFSACLALLGLQQNAHLTNSFSTLNQFRQTREISYQQLDKSHQICAPVGFPHHRAKYVIYAQV